nr:hypothetical protein [Corynebacterium pseudotuberculosis]
MFGVSTRWIRELLHRYNTGGYQASSHNLAAHTPTHALSPTTSPIASSPCANNSPTAAPTPEPTPSNGTSSRKDFPPRRINHPSNPEQTRPDHATTTKAPTQLLDQVPSRHTQRI